MVSAGTRYYLTQKQIYKIGFLRGYMLFYKMIFATFTDLKKTRSPLKMRPYVNFAHVWTSFVSLQYKHCRVIRRWVVILYDNVIHLNKEIICHSQA